MSYREARENIANADIFRSILNKTRDIRRTLTTAGKPIQRGSSSKLGTMKPQDARIPGAVGSIPSSAGFKPGEGQAYQDRLAPPAKRTPPPAPPRKNPPAQRPPAPVPATPAVQSGNSQQRVDRFTGASLASTPSPFGAGFNPLGTPQIDRAALEASIKGEGWTNAGVVAGTQTDMNATVKNPFAKSQLTMASFGGQTPAVPQAPAGFALAGSLMSPSQQAPAPTAPGFAPPVAGPGIVMPEVQPGALQAAYTSGADLTAAPAVDSAVAPTEAAQNFASGAVNEVMSLQNQIRERRGMPLLVE